MKAFLTHSIVLTLCNIKTAENDNLVQLKSFLFMIFCQVLNVWMERKRIELEVSEFPDKSLKQSVCSEFRVCC